MVADEGKQKQLNKSSSTPIASESNIQTIVQDSKLLDLPSELLTHILSFLLVREDGCPVTLRSAKDRRWHNEISKLTDIEWTVAYRIPRHYHNDIKVLAPVTKSDLLKALLVSRDFYFAGVAAFFGGNILKFDSTASLARLAKKLDVDRRRHIARVMIESDMQNDRGETLIPGQIDTAHEPEALYIGMQRLPALKEIMLDFKLGGAAPPFVWGRLKAHMVTLRKGLDTAPVRITFAIDDKPSDLENKKM